MLEELQSLRGDRAVVEAAIESWEDGTVAPHDVLIAIRDQIQGRVPGEEAKRG
jgi:hypothetical protein